ncbi:MAG: hypothetical protein AB8B52_11260 [Winogradskyella sp.]|uniref:hypothetical protein n=1 Tax=Winogradskyella sp. TaxID=1883156 RepID=UPI00385DFEE2
MKIKHRYIVICFLLGLLSFTACQDEISETENQNEQDSIAPNSTLSNLMSRTTANSGTADAILDGASCFSIELPVTVVINDTTFIIETLLDLEPLENLLNDDAVLDFVFPITIIFNDYSEIVIENEDTLQSFIDQCNSEENEIITCVDFVYPIVFSVFNASFNLIDTVVFNNDEALYNFLQNLEENEDALIVSLNFPMSLIYENGDIIEVNTNGELADAIAAAEQYCETENDNCTLEDVALNLVECPWDFTDGTDTFTNYQMVFNANGDLLIPEGLATSAIGGSWSLSNTDNALILTLSELTAFQDTLEGDWLITACVENVIEITRANTTLTLQKDCEGDLGCSVAEINADILECAWRVETELVEDINPFFVHFAPNGAVNIEGVDNMESQIGTWEIITIAADVFINYTFQQGFEELNGQWQIVECEQGSLYLVSANNSITLEQKCEVNNQALLDCYGIYIFSQECDDNNDGIATFIIETNGAQTEECLALYPLAGSYHATYEDAVNSANLLYLPLTAPLELESQIIYFRIFNQELQEYAVQELELIVESCNEEVFNCFGDYELLECANDAGEAEFNLSAETIGLVDCAEPFTATFHFSLADAQNNTQPIANTESYFSIQGEVYLRINADSGNFQVFTIYLNTDNCNLFECFESVYPVLEVCDNGTDGPYEFNLPSVYDNCTADDIRFYYSVADAESDTNIIANPTAFSTVEINSTVYVRVDLSGQTLISPLDLNVIDCNSDNCTASDIDGILTACNWNITSYNGSDNLIDYNFNFEENSGIVVIYTDAITIDASWLTAQTNDGVIIEFSNVNGSNIQAITGSWLVVECTASQLVLHNVNDSSNEIVIDRTCE